MFTSPLLCEYSEAALLYKLVCFTPQSTFPRYKLGETEYIYFLLCVPRWLKDSYMVDLLQHSYTPLMSPSKALWDTSSSSSSHKHNKCRKHSSNRRNSNKGNTNIPKTRLAVFQTSEICWLGSVVHCARVQRSPSVPSVAARCGIRKSNLASSSAVGMLECKKLLLVTVLLTWSCRFRGSQCVCHWSENHKQRPRWPDVTCGDLRTACGAGPPSPTRDTTARTSGLSELSRRCNLFT